jgi:hypothetical protein
MTEAVQEHAAGGELPIYMPQRMAFSQFKTPPGFKPDWGQNFAGLHTALERQKFVAEMIRRGHYLPPMTTPHAMAEQLGADRLPEPSDNIDPDLDTQAVSRGLIPSAGFVSGAELNALGREMASELEHVNGAAQDRRAQALAEVAELQNHLGRLFTRS